MIGSGVGMVETGRLRAALRRTPEPAGRLFAESEHGTRAVPQAASFAAGEAVAGPLGARCWHLPLSHDSGMSVAMVVARG